MKKHIRKAGVTGMIFASLAAPGAVSASPDLVDTCRPTALTNDAAARRNRESAYQQRLTFLAGMLETDRRELELALTRLAHRA